MNALSTLTIDELKQGREDTFSDEMLRAIDAELARREQAQDAELAAENEQLRKANAEQAQNFLATMDGWDATSKLAQERGERIVELERDNARLRSLLDEAHTALSVEALANAHKQGMSYDDAVKKMCEIDLLKRIEEAV